MCIGVPMKIRSVDGLEAIAEAEGRAPETLDLALVGQVAPGDWVLAFLGAARQRLDEAEACRIADALKGVARAMNGDGVGDAFSDLTDREPCLPPHLEAARQAGARTA